MRFWEGSQQGSIWQKTMFAKVQVYNRGYVPRDLWHIPAVLYATVSAGYTIQQRGLPQIEYKRSSSTDTMELWNGDLPGDRLERLKRRCTMSEK
jgi:hypothetical protein